MKIQNPLSFALPLAQSCATGQPLQMFRGDLFMQSQLIFEEEIWKPIGGYENHYAISTFGKVRSFKRKKPHLLKIKYKSNDYAFVCLCKNSNQKYYHVHRLVALAFIPNPERKPQVNHLDLDKRNCRVDNLEWSTQSENQIHARKNKIYKLNPIKGISHSKSTPLIQKSVDGEVLFVWENQSFACRFYGASSGAIHTALGRTKISLGFKWEICSKEFYENNAHKYITPPPPIIIDLRSRDLRKAQSVKINKINSIPKELFIKHGLLCLNQYGNIHRATFEKYARENKIGSYTYVIKRFSTWDNFKNIINSQNQLTG